MNSSRSGNWLNKDLTKEVLKAAFTDFPLHGSSQLGSQIFHKFVQRVTSISTLRPEIADKAESISASPTHDRRKQS